MAPVTEATAHSLNGQDVVQLQSGLSVAFTLQTHESASRAKGEGHRGHSTATATQSIGRAACPGPAAPGVEHLGTSISFHQKRPLG